MAPVILSNQKEDVLMHLLFLDFIFMLITFIEIMKPHAPSGLKFNN
ncbi:hypothetical protein LGAS_0037 [Lactobacillus gasseri ATCC 33323 = JCM 1131]|uniref:Uncharacterized protein n=1 Tax=Lactobacillus gasseri (strain ATCC 33323 / DSM 20243 / BCRC 14619 / CIP 102991 / JCM 1131 / KCTC 3163 / NCIMB 11718 / NCTC 13722 / AM63) TaxID=324831 RepID=A0A805YS02_LACGA|nr:hypothetical protein LGAS_0037 [Lactobacillus gasseri ATCC 33323 = JCM 1131]